MPCKSYTCIGVILKNSVKYKNKKNGKYAQFCFVFVFKHKNVLNVT